MSRRISLYRKPSAGRWPSRNSKRREVLSVNMISLPLADFRHISHIGNDIHTDSFGDLSFLKNGHSLLLQSSQSEQNLFLACSPPPKPPRLNLDETDSTGSPDLSERQHSTSQKRKKCSSMPLLDSRDGDSEVEREDGHQRVNSDASNQTQAPERNSVNSDMDGDLTVTWEKSSAKQKDEDSGFSFTLDLGPSILDDVLQVMEQLHK
ncbi:cdc42 effector protein 3-like [Mugil cephalus]|uniref:cdc42 effector protein 3-like n=1 Tax=Mugil cephalus TaxID=48193 RepID=UPI001FB63C7C|nr:cdc42 effector protein 3-like [Mugil cephalus]